jgi:uracil phosphoribosyltransferase
MVICQKTKGGKDVTMHWPGVSKIAESNVVVLDVVIASGDTIAAVWNEVCARSATRNPATTIISCYAAPQGIDRLLKLDDDISVVVGALAERVLPSGWLFPLTGGDVGDKLYRF